MADIIKKITNNKKINYFTTSKSNSQNSIYPTKATNTDIIKPVYMNKTETVDLTPIEKKVSINYDGINTLLRRKVQGYTETKDKIYITAHENKQKSKIYVYDKKTGDYEGYITLNNSDHAGGISYDDVNDIIYVTASGGRITTIDNSVITRAIETSKIIPNHGEELLNLNETIIDKDGKEVPKYNDAFIVNDANMGLDGKNAASVYYYDGYVYMVTFTNVSEKGTLKITKPTITYDKDGKKEINCEDISTTKLGNNIQGLAVTEYNGKKYLLTTHSMGPHTSGKITTYIINDDGSLKYQGIHYAKPGIQGIDIDENGNVVYISEFNEIDIPLISKYNKNETVITTMDELTHNYDESIFNSIKSDIGLKLGDIIYDTIDAIGGEANCLGSGIKDIKNADNILEVFSSLNNMIKDTKANCLTYLVSLTKYSINNDSNLLLDEINAIMYIRNLVGETKEKLNDKACAIVSDIVECWPVGMDIIKKNVSNNLNEYKDNWSDGYDMIKDEIKDTANEFADNWSTGYDMIKDDATDAANDFVDNWSSGYDMIKDSTSNALDDYISGWGELISWF